MFWCIWPEDDCTTAHCLHFNSMVDLSHPVVDEPCTVQMANGRSYRGITAGIGMFCTYTNIPYDSHLLVLIRCFTKTGLLWLQAYLQCLLVRVSEGYGYGHPTGTGTGVRQIQVRAYHWNGNRHSNGRSMKHYCDTYRTTLVHTYMHNDACM